MLSITTGSTGRSPGAVGVVAMASTTFWDSGSVTVTENGMMVGQVTSCVRIHSDEELRTVGAGASIRHGQQVRTVKAQLGVELVGELVAGAPRPVPVGSPPWIMKPSMTRWKIDPS